MKTDHPIRSLCEALEVSASGYYDWFNRQAQPGPRAQENARLAQQIVQIHQASRQTYGSPRIQVVLRQAGHAHGRHRIARLMRQQGLCGRAKGRFRVCTTDSNHDQPIAPNRLPELPPPSAPNQIWVGDITYIPTEEGWLYLAGILDLYSRRLAGWAMSEHIDTQLILAAWGMALTHRQPPAGLVFHSDRGVQYASHDYRHALQQRPGHRLHEPQRQLLRQCRHGILLEHPQTRTHLPPPLQNPSRGPPGHLRFHRGLLQPPTPP